MLPNTVIKRLESLLSRSSEISNILSSNNATDDIANFTKLTKEFSDINPIIEKYSQYKELKDSLEDARGLLSSREDEIVELAKTEVSTIEEQLIVLEHDLKILLLPKDSADDASAYLEIRSGAGGDEASIFALDLFRLYSRLCERKSWQVEVLTNKVSEQGGTKEAVIKIEGKGAYRFLKFESGVHRVQRVPETESQGRIHTSTVTVAVLPEVDEVEDIEIDKNDLRVDTFRASGAGGQHVNKTDSAIRLTHLPSGLVVECQDDRSQHKNKAKAMALLATKLKAKEIQEQQENIANERKILVGSGDRSEKIRTYNFPQGRVTDHRIKLTQHNLDQVMDGDIDSICSALQTEHQLTQLSHLESDE
tara:strand:+ start:5027 stop:6118 length:1092 start_codon:yes stop_codon:yes gene_type:complete